MKKMTGNILKCNSTQARKFFLKQESFINFRLPPYFDFNKILSNVSKEINKNVLINKELKKAKEIEFINHSLYVNKEGKYTWRKLDIINPLLYVSLVNVITEKNNWAYLKNKFLEYQANTKIVCESLPAIPREKERQNASQISWWNENIVNKSLSLSLNFQYLFQTDISDCYSSIYTHSIPWAIHTKKLSKESLKDNKKSSALFGNKIDNHIRAMTYGQTNGIPLGSILMDFIAEIVLGYADLLLSEKLSGCFDLDDYHIIRYRDDYKIFTNSSSDGEKILKRLSETLLDLGLKLNPHKTLSSEDIVINSIKKDKIEELKYGNVPENLEKGELLRQLLIIEVIGNKFPNSGTIRTRLSKIIKFVKKNDFRYHKKELVAVLIDIAYKNPKSFPNAAKLISRFITTIPLKERKELILDVKKKICSLSNVGYLEVWLQRLAIRFYPDLEFEEKLCKNIFMDGNTLFDTKWIDNNSIKSAISGVPIFDKEKLSKIPKIIKDEEVQLFGYLGN